MQSAHCPKQTPNSSGNSGGLSFFGFAMISSLIPATIQSTERRYGESGAPSLCTDQ
jgi:hypothetical protein